MYGRVVVFLFAAALAGARDRTFDLHLQIEPHAVSAVYIHGSTNPFTTASLSDASGRVRFKKLLAGPYTVSAVVRGYGEVRQTIEVGAGLADDKGRVRVTLRVPESGTLPESVRQRVRVSAKQLRVTRNAWKEFHDAQKDLERRDVKAALAHLLKAVELSPQFATAWNNLGTIAYQTKEYKKAEGYFREALVQDPGAYEPLVNLGGVLLNLGKHGEALAFNRHAVSRRPEDALANSQLGMNYFALGKADPAIQYLNTAKKLDPAHFSHPQLTLAEIYLRKGDTQAAAGELEEFLKLHPDWPAAASVEKAIEKLRRDK